YAAKDDRIIVIHKKNEGLSCARNTGLDVITGEYIAYVDSDDHLDVTMIEKMMHLVLAHDLDVIEILPDNRNNRNECDNSFIIEDPVQATKRILINTAFSVWRSVFKKEFVQDFRFIPGLIHQDVFYTMDTLKRLPKYGHLKSVLYFYNIDSISIIRSKYSLEKITVRSEEHTSELQSRENLVCRLLLEKKNRNTLSQLHTAIARSHGN